MENLRRFFEKKKILVMLSLVLILILSGCSADDAIASTPDEVIETLADTQEEMDETTKTEIDKTAYSELFDDEKVHEINIEIAAADWAELLANPQDETYYSASITVDGNFVSDVGFRTKGNSSLKSVANSESERYSFRVKIDRYIDDQNLMGLDEFVLNNMFSDPSYLREHLSYKIMGEEGLNVPLNNFVQVKINDELYGLYLMVEAIDDSYLTRLFGDNDGNLYKQESGSTLVYEENSEYKNSEQKNGKDESKEDLSNFIKILNDMPIGEKGDIESVLDVESALKYIAANTVLENYDSYNGKFAQNYYLYNNEGKFVVLPWDYNMSFGGFPEGAQSDAAIDEPISGTTMENVPMISKLLSVAEYKERYYEIIEEYIVLLGDFENQVTALADKIRPYVEADPTKFITMEQFEYSVAYQEVSETQKAPIANENPIDAQTNVTPYNGPERGALPSDEEAFSSGERPVFGETPEARERPEPGVRPDNGQFSGGMIGNRQGGVALSGTEASLINIVQSRLENLRNQLNER